MKLTTAQREHLTRLACSTEARVPVKRETGWSHTVLGSLQAHGLVVVTPQTPGPHTVEITDKGRAVVERLVAAEAARGSR